MLFGLVAEFVRHPKETTALIVRRIGEIPSKGLPQMRRDPNDGFDEKYGVETSRPVQVTVTDSPNLVHGTRYEAATEEAIRWAIDNCGLDPESATFVDIGCGKGRALVVANTYPFKAIIGVEYAPDLAAVARANLDKIGAGPRCSVITGDAVDYRFPEGPLLAFFYNPFHEAVHRQVLANLAQAGGPIRIAHCGPGNAVVQASGLALDLGGGPGATRLYTWGA